MRLVLWICSQPQPVQIMDSHFSVSMVFLPKRVAIPGLGAWRASAGLLDTMLCRRVGGPVFPHALAFCFLSDMLSESPKDG